MLSDLIESTSCLLCQLRFFGERNYATPNEETRKLFWSTVSPGQSTWPTFCLHRFSVATSFLPFIQSFVIFREPRRLRPVSCGCGSARHKNRATDRSPARASAQPRWTAGHRFNHVLCLLVAVRRCFQSSTNESSRSFEHCQNQSKSTWEWSFLPGQKPIRTQLCRAWASQYCNESFQRRKNGIHWIIWGTICMRTSFGLVYLSYHANGIRVPCKHRCSLIRRIPKFSATSFFIASLVWKNSKTAVTFPIIYPDFNCCNHGDGTRALHKKRVKIFRQIKIRWQNFKHLHL